MSYLIDAISFSSEVKAKGSLYPIQILSLLHTAAWAVQGGWERAGKEEWSLWKRANMISLRRDKAKSCCWLRLEGSDGVQSPCPSRATWNRLPGGKIFSPIMMEKWKRRILVYAHSCTYTWKGIQKLLWGTYLKTCWFQREFTSMDRWQRAYTRRKKHFT